MTQITQDDVQHLAQLSNLQLSDDDVASLQKDLTAIIGYIDELSELDTSGVEPTYQVTDLQNVWREDEVNTYGLEGEELLSLAPDMANHHIKVPKVL